MISEFLKDIRGNYALMTAVVMTPLMGALALAVDYTEMGRQHQAMVNALDTANLAAARQLQAGASDADVLAYTRLFFDANLGPVDPAVATLTTILPNKDTGSGTLKSTGCLDYDPYFYPVFIMLLNGGGSGPIRLCSDAEVRLKNTLEVALVLDNSGSMKEKGFGSSKVRFDLLKDASKQLVDELAKRAGMIKQVSNPVQFALVPFAASVNVGPENASASWMDTDGRSPIHYENFQLPATLGPKKLFKFDSGAYRKIGADWGAQENQIFTRFTLYDDLLVDWQGCAEVRPYPYGVNDEAPKNSDPATHFVPMFAPDETDLTDRNLRPANNNWWNDHRTGNGNSDLRQRGLEKYYQSAPKDAMGIDEGPNASCTTKPVTPLTDVTKATGRTKIKDAIDAMVSNGATNVPEGMAWGWRMLSSTTPFTEGRPEIERGNDKVVIVLTDGANTYYTPQSVVARNYSGANWLFGGNDLAPNRSIYSAYGYAYMEGVTTPRIFAGTSSKVKTSDYSNSNYTKAMNEHFEALCDNAKSAKIIVMTVALDLDEKKTVEKEQIEALKKCSSDSRYRKDPFDQSKAAKLFWNTTGGELEKTFKEIADELSNLRIIS
jgi:Flp pilus assembly protein TadG